MLDALEHRQAVLAGYDWGGRAACVLRRCGRSGSRASSAAPATTSRTSQIRIEPADPEQEARLWYQYYFHTERGRNGLTEKRHELSRLLWKMWSPTWTFDDATFDRTAGSFDNADFVDVVINSYRHRNGNIAGDPRYETIEARLAAQPKINVPTIDLHGAADGVIPARASETHDKHFTAPYERRVLENVGHNPPQEAPHAFADAILQLCRNASALKYLCRCSRCGSEDAERGKCDPGQRQQPRDPRQRDHAGDDGRRSQHDADLKRRGGELEVMVLRLARSRSSSACLARSDNCSGPSPVSGSER